MACSFNANISELYTPQELIGEYAVRVLPAANGDLSYTSEPCLITSEGGNIYARNSFANYKMSEIYRDRAWKKVLSTDIEFCRENYERVRELKAKSVKSDEVRLSRTQSTRIQTMIHEVRGPSDDFLSELKRKLLVGEFQLFCIFHAYMLNLSAYLILVSLHTQRK